VIAILLGAALAVAGPRLVVDAPLTAAAPCDTSAPRALQAALQSGIALRWKLADRLFPEVRLERALARRVVVRATGVAVCGGRVIGTDVTARIVGPRGMPIEVVIATRLRPGPVLAVTEADVQVRPPPGSARITARDTWTAYGTWELGALRPASSAGEQSDPEIPGVQSQLSM
jgi:hypothetical protein